MNDLLARIEELIDQVSSGSRLLYTRQGAADMLSLSVPEIDNLRREGDLIAQRHGRAIRFHITELRRYAKSLPVDVPGAGGAQ